MDVHHKRRTGGDRREFAHYYRHAHERRNNRGNRRLNTVEELQPCLTGRVSQDYDGDSDRSVEIIKEIADAFGVHPDSLERVERNDLMDSTEFCQSCVDWAKMNAELETELAESRKDVDRYRNQVRDLLLSFNSSRQ